MRIFLAGATGAIGRLLLPLLVTDGYQVVGTSRSAAKSQQISATGGIPVIVDMMDRPATLAALKDAQPDVVMHQLTDLSNRDFGANSRLRTEGTRNLIDAALAVGVKHIIAQSISWVYVGGSAPATEEEPLDVSAPDSRGRTVAAVRALEQAVAEIERWVVLRYGILYGPGTWYARDGLTTEQVRRGELSATDAVTSFVHVADAAQAARVPMQWSSGVVNVVNDEPARGTDWLPVYAQLVQAPPPVAPGAQPWERGASNGLARRLGWQPRYPSWREGFTQELSG